MLHFMNKSELLDAVGNNNLIDEMLRGAHGLLLINELNLAEGLELKTNIQMLLGVGTSHQKIKHKIQNIGRSPAF